MEGGGFTAKTMRIDGLEYNKSGGLAVPPDLQTGLGCPWIENSRCTATSCGNHAIGFRSPGSTGSRAA